MFANLSLPVLLATFAVAAGIIWWAGIKLSNTTDVLAHRFGLGDALGGVILLAIATNLPEIAITASAAWRGEFSVATGNLLGGIAVQTVVLAVLDAAGSRGRPPLTRRVRSLVPVLEGVLVVAVLAAAVMASRLPADLVALRIAPGGVLIAALWIAGLWLIGRAGRGLPWRLAEADDAAERPGNDEGGGDGAKRPATSTARAALVFALAAAATLACGVVLERSGDALAQHFGMSGVLFGATVLAAATALPELSTGYASIRLGDDALAISDVLGGNAFLPVLFGLATLVSGQAVLPRAGGADLYLAALGILLTCAYLCGLIFRPAAKPLGMGADSLAVVLLYALGVAGLFAVAAG